MNINQHSRSKSSIIDSFQPRNKAIDRRFYFDHKKESQYTLFTPLPPPTQIFLNHCFQLLQGIAIALREIENTLDTHTNFCGHK